MTIELYQSCPCGSGKKYKFCCRERDRSALAARPSGSVLDPVGLKDLIDAGCRRNERGDFAGAAELFEKARSLAPHQAQAYTNLALARFHLGEAEEALALVLRVTRLLEPKNVFALGSVVHYAMVLGRDEEALAAAEALRRIRAPDPGAHFKQCEAFARLDWHSDILRTASQVHLAPETVRADLYFFLGVAAANLARYDEALEFLRLAAPSPNYTTVAARYAEQLEKGRARTGASLGFTYLSPHQWVSCADLARIQKREKPQGPGFVEMLLDEVKRGEVTAVHALADLGGDRAIAALRGIAGGTSSTREIRMAALYSLLQIGALEPGRAVKLWDGARWVEVVPTATEVVPEPAHPVPDEHAEALERAHELARLGQSRAAEAVLRELDAVLPDHPVVHYNRGVELVKLGECDRARELFARARRIAPSYLFPVLALAELLLAEGRAAEARETMKGAVLPERAHPHLIRFYLLVEARISIAEGEFRRALGNAEALQRIDPAIDSIGTISIAELRRAARSDIDSTEDPGPEHASRHARLLSAVPGLQECLEGWSVAELRRIASAFGIRRVSSARKSELVSAMVEQLRRKDTLEVALQAIEARARAALRAILLAGGRMELAEFHRSFGDEAAERARRKKERRPSILYQLERTALVAVGLVGAHPAVVVPFELRATLAELEQAH